jgi:hypothetical protein
LFLAQGKGDAHSSRRGAVPRAQLALSPVSPASRATVASISRREMEIDGGSLGTASHENHRASAISVSSGLSSPPAYSAVYAIISECGNAHDWLEK